MPNAENIRKLRELLKTMTVDEIADYVQEQDAPPTAEENLVQTPYGVYADEPPRTRPYRRRVQEFRIPVEYLEFVGDEGQAPYHVKLKNKPAAMCYCLPRVAWHGLGSLASLPVRKVCTLCMQLLKETPIEQIKKWGVGTPQPRKKPPEQQVGWLDPGPERPHKPLFAAPAVTNWLLFRFQLSTRTYEYRAVYITREKAETAAEALNKGHKIGWEQSVYRSPFTRHDLIVLDGVSGVMSQYTYTIVGL